MESKRDLRLLISLLLELSVQSGSTNSLLSCHIHESEQLRPAFIFLTHTKALEFHHREFQTICSYCLEEAGRDPTDMGMPSAPSKPDTFR